MLKEHLRARGVGYIAGYVVWLALVGGAVLADDLTTRSTILFFMLVAGVGLLGGATVLGAWLATEIVGKRMSR